MKQELWPLKPNQQSLNQESITVYKGSKQATLWSDFIFLSLPSKTVKSNFSLTKQQLQQRKTNKKSNSLIGNLMLKAFKQSSHQFLGRGYFFRLYPVKSVIF